MQRIRTILLLFTFLFTATGLLLSQASDGSDAREDIRPPVSLTTRVREATPNALVTEVSITAHVEVANATLVVKLSEQVTAEPGKVALRLDKGKTATVAIRIQARQNGDHRLVFIVEASAPRLERAGTTARRYLVVDGKQPARLLSEHGLRRLQRQRAAERVTAEKGTRVQTMDEYLAGHLAKIPSPPVVKEDRRAALALPAPLESYDVVKDPSAKVAATLDPITITARLFYVNRAGVLRPLVNATVDIYDREAGADDFLVTTITDWHGEFSATVNNNDGAFADGRDIYFRARATNARFRVRDCAGDDWTYAWRSEVRKDVEEGSVVDFGGLQLVNYEEAAIVFQDMNLGWNYLTVSGGQDPGRTTVCFPEDGSYYSTGTKKFYIEACDESATSPWVAVDVVLHEYGHATMHNAYDGYWPPNTGGPHGFDDILDPNFAFTEGWATFIGLSIISDGVYNSCGWSQNIEIFVHGTVHTAGDGEQNEGHVAAGMGDVRDRTVDGACATGTCDPSGDNSVPMSTIWRGAFWGSKADNIDEYVARLCQDIDPAAQRQTAARALEHNHIEPFLCACAVEAAVEGAPNGATIIKSLRELRQKGLRGSNLGEWVLTLYHRHSNEVATLISKDPELRRTALILFSRAAGAYEGLVTDKDEVLLDARHAGLARRFVEQLQLAGSKQLKHDFDAVKHLINEFESVRSSEFLNRLDEKPK